VDGRTPTIALILILALGFAPAERKIRRIIEDRLYPERVRLQALLGEFLHGRRQSELGRGFWKELEGKLLAGIGAKRIYPVLLRGHNEAWCADECDLVPFEISEEFIALIGASGHPLLFDEIVASRKITLDRDLRDWLDARDVAVILPLSTQTELIGLLLLSSKTNGEDYTHEELRLLDSLAAQIAIVAENVELLEDKLEKQRLEEQLEIARHVQEGLLPKSLPRIQNLELAAKIRFCLDVAGDYYDVIPQENGSALLAVGDVSGKGVGPALLMANLQAALRAVKDIGRPFRDVMANINTHVHENTSPELFITLFVTLVEPESGKICFINAGHNAPILLRENGEVERLRTTGLLLGVVPEAEYREQTLQINTGDTVLMFTDGVTEAMNAMNEEFGEDRLIDLMRENRDLPVSQLLDKIEEQVRAFRGQRSFDDDFTLLAARVANDLRRQ
jgi:sigma-B regulation protein RsbU (phosphoserine phosphatase)